MKSMATNHDADAADASDLKVFFEIRHELDYQPMSCLHLDIRDDDDDDDDDDDTSLRKVDKKK